MKLAFCFLLFFVLPAVQSQVQSPYSITNFISLVQTVPGLLDFLQNTETTVFAPTNGALSLINQDFLNDIPRYSDFQEILLYHIVPGRRVLQPGTYYTESKHRPLHVSYEDYPKVNGIQVVEPNATTVLAGKAVVHIIADILIPHEFVPSGVLSEAKERLTEISTFLTALSLTKLEGALETLFPTKTLFIPTDAAFAKLPKGLLFNLLKPENRNALRDLLLNHVVPRRATSRGIYSTLLAGRSVALSGNTPNFIVSSVNANGTTVVQTTIAFSNIFGRNGFVHLVNDVLLPDNFPLVATVLGGVPNLKTFSSLLSFVSPLLATTSSYTIFAPSDEAFSKLPPDYLNFLLQASPAAVSEVLSNHIVPSALTSQDLMGLTSVKSLRVNTPNVLSVQSWKSGLILINGSKVLQSDILVPSFVRTGIVHVVDTFIFPGDIRIVSLLDFLRSNVNYTTFFTAFSRTQVFYPPVIPGRFGDTTLFLPTNDAFALLPKGYLEFLLKPENRDKLTNAVLYHFARGRYSPNQFNQNGNFTIVSTSNRQTFFVLNSPLEDYLYVNPADEITFNDAAFSPSAYITNTTNVYLIDRVILPASISPVDLYDTAVANGYVEFARLVDFVNLTSTLKQIGRELYTVFVPTNAQVVAARARVTNPAQLRSIVLSHIIPGAYLAREIFAGNATTTTLSPGKTLVYGPNFNGVNSISGVPVLTTDVIAKNGIIQVIDGLIP